MNSSRTGAVAGVLAVVALLARAVPGILLSRWVSGSPGQGAVPLFGSIGVTVSAYSSIVDIVGVVVPVGLGMALGLWITRKARTTAELRRGLKAVAIGSAAAVLLVATIPVAMWSTPIDVAGVGLFVIVVVQHLVSASLLVTIGAVTGAALDRFALGPDEGNRPTEDPKTGARSSGETGVEDHHNTQSTPE